MEQILKSVGIDIGTTTTQMVLCAIKIENFAQSWTVPSVRIVDKTLLYKSDIYFTPLKDAQTIDVVAIKKIILDAYQKAKLSPGEVDTGAVIITGEAARKENAQEIITLLSGLAGNFVVTTAGPDLEGILAGKGSGACAHSESHACTVMNVDVGGGTTNIAVFNHGDALESACFDIGGRLIQLDVNQKVTYISSKMKLLIETLRANLIVGKHADLLELKKITDAMASAIVSIAKGNYEDPIVNLLITNHGLKEKFKLKGLFFSGGIADCMKENKAGIFEYGDIGVLLGQSLTQALLGSDLPVLIANETIRATVIGAGIHTTSISGSTINYDSGVLPLKNIPVVKLSFEEEKNSGITRIEAIKKRLNWVVHEGVKPLIAFSITGSSHYGFDALQVLAEDILKGLSQVVESDQPIIISVEHDMAKALGLSLRRNLSKEKPVICIDSIRVDNGDYIDIGMPIADGQVLPVIIKTLLFGY